MSPLSNRSDLDSMTQCVIGDITLDCARRRVSRGEVTIGLGTLTFELLLLLVDSAPSVVSYDEIAERLWHGRPVSADTIRQRAKLLRRALGDDPAAPRYIRVVRGHGYRLIPEVVPLVPPHSARPSARAFGLTSSQLGLIAIAAITIVYGVRQFVSEPSSTEPDEYRYSAGSVAVLPFENLSGNQADDYLVDGIHSDVITQLSKIASLRVISRSSVTEYLESPKSASQIGRELGVATILEGSVQSAANEVRINAQLTSAATGETIWAELYSRALTAEDVFEIQSEMATSIASAMRATLTPEDVERLEYMPTNSVSAYNYFLLGRSRLRRADNLVDFPDAANAFESAVAEDPEFAIAWTELAQAYLGMYYFIDRTELLREKARSAIERAFEIDPNLSEAHLARGYFYYQVFGDIDRAIGEWDLAERSLPGDTRIFMARAYAYRRLGAYEDAARNLSYATAVDPHNPENIVIYLETLCYLRDYDRAARYAEQLIAINPQRSHGYRVKAQLALWRAGDGAAALDVLASSPIELKLSHLRWRAHVLERDYDSALHVLETWELEARNWRARFQPTDWFSGVTYDLAGDPERAAIHFRNAREEASRTLEQHPTDARAMIALADIMARQGEYDGAAELLQHAVAAIPSSVPAPQRYWVHLSAILALAAARDYGGSILELEKYLANSSPWSVDGLLRDPRFDPIREDERVIALAAAYRQP